AGDPNLDHRADIYAVGILAYEMLSGGPPFVGTPQSVMAAHINTRPPSISSRADIPLAMQRMVMKCLAKDPADRYQSADDLLADIEAVGTPSGALPSVVRVSPRRVLAWTGVAVTLVALVWFGTAGMRRERWLR